MSNAVQYMKIPQVRWYLLANRSEAVLFKKIEGDEFEFLERIRNKKGRRREQELSKDRPGRTVNSVGNNRHSLGNENAHHEHTGEIFAKHLVEHLAHEKNNGRYDELVLVAEPHFLGLLRKSLPKNLESCIKDEIPKEYKSLDKEETNERIQLWLKNPEKSFH